MPRAQDLSPPGGRAGAAGGEGAVPALVGRLPDAEQRAALCDLAAHLLLRELDPPALAAMRAPDALEVLDKLAPGCREHLERAWEAADFDREAAELCRLFVLPGGVSPFAAAWLDEAEARAVGAACSGALAELAVDPSLPDGLPPDHLGIVLLVLAESWRCRDADAMSVSVLTRSLSRGWLAPWCARLAAEARSPLYQALAVLVAAVTGMAPSVDADHEQHERIPSPSIEDIR